MLTAVDELFTEEELLELDLSEMGVVGHKDAPDHWRDWLRALFPHYFDKPFADRHVTFWEWIDALEPGVRPDPLVAIWARGGAKSTNAEAAAVYVGAKDKRRYVWFISETQYQADEHVATIAAMLESAEVETYHPRLAARKLGKYGHSRGWRRNRLRTDSGLTIDSLGLDTARRGFKVEEQRPDMMIFDDIDGELDTVQATEKKESVITKKLLPAGSSDCALLFIQNLIIPHGIFAKLSDGRAAYLANRIVSGPHPAVEGLVTENIDGRDMIVSGDPTWEGQPLDSCQQFIDDWGLRAFLEECQHDVYTTDQQIFAPAWWSLEDGRNRYDATDGTWRNKSIARYLFVDTAFKDKQTNDPSAAAVIDLLNDYRIIVRHVWNERLQSAYLPDKMEELAARFNRDDKLKAVIIEDKGSGTTTIQTLRASAPSWLAKMIVEFMPHGDKPYRAKNASVWCGRDCVLLPYPSTKNTDWYADFLDDELGQLYRFPQAAHDDMVDVFVMAILYLEHFLKLGWQLRTGQMKRQDHKERKRHPRIEAALKKPRSRTHG